MNERDMNTNDIILNSEDQFRIGFGGGSLFLECKKCGKDISSGEVPFPGTNEQQAPVREKFEQIKKVHKCL